MLMPPTLGYGDGGWNTPPRDAVDPDNSPGAAWHAGNMQALLTIRGFIDEKSEDTGALPVDTKIGYGTVAAIEGFQMSAGLDPDGVCGPMTWTALIQGH